MNTPEDLKNRYTYIQPCCVDDTPDAHTVWIKIEGQSFAMHESCVVCPKRDMEHGVPSFWRDRA